VDVAARLAKRLAIEKQGDEFGELSDSHPLQQNLEKLTEDEKEMTLGEMYNNQLTVLIRLAHRWKRVAKERRQQQSHVEGDS